MAVISKLFDNYEDAQRAVAMLESAGVPHSDISIIANNGDGWYNNETIDRDRDGSDDRMEGAGTGAGVGAALGGGAGLLAGLGLIAIPGLGPVVAAGWLAAAATVAVAGGAVGGIVGALTQSGVSDEDAHVYAEGVRRGGTLVTARVAEGQQTALERVLNSSAVPLVQRREAYQSEGWSRFDATAKPLTSEDIRKRRARFDETGTLL